MKQEDSVVKIIKIEDKAPAIGKCCMCTRQIVNDPDEFWCAQSRLIVNNYYCGWCLLELAPIINEVKKEFLKQKIDSHIEGTDKFYNIDQATGRMVLTEGIEETEVEPEKITHLNYNGFQLKLVDEYDS